MRVRGRVLLLGFAALACALAALIGWQQQMRATALENLALDSVGAVTTRATQGELNALDQAQEVARARVDNSPTATSSSEEPARHTVTIEGTVLQAVGQEQTAPIEGATIRVVVEDELLDTATTDAQGHYSASVTLDMNERQQLFVCAWAPGFLVYEHMEWPPHFGTYRMDFDLTPGAVLRGRVENAEGQAVKRCGVFWLVEGMQWRYDITNSRGEYEIGVQELGSGSLVARHAEIGISKQLALRIAAYEISEAPTLVLQIGGVLSGRVVNQQGRPIEQARLRFHSKRWILNEGQELDSFVPEHFLVTGLPKELYLEATGLAGAQAATDSEGRFEVIGLDPGLFGLMVETIWQKANFVLSTDSRELELVIQHHTLLVRFTADDGQPMPGLNFRLSSVHPEGDPRNHLRLPWHITPGDSPGFRFDVEPEQQYRLTVSQYQRADAEFPHARLVEAHERLIMIGSSDDEVLVDVILKRCRPSGTLHLDPGLLRGDDTPDAVVIEVRNESGVLVLHDRYSSRDEWSAGVPPGVYDVLLKPVRFGRTPSGASRADWTVAAKSAFARKRAGAEVSQAPSDNDWSQAVTHRLQVSEGLETEIPQTLPRGGHLLVVLRREKGQPAQAEPREFPPGSFQRNTVPLPGTLTLAGHEGSKSDALDFAVRILHDEWPAEIESAYETTRGLKPGRWTWKAQVEGFQPIEIEFEIRSECITAVVAILRPD